MLVLLFPSWEREPAFSICRTLAKTARLTLTGTLTAEAVTHRTTTSSHAPSRVQAQALSRAHPRADTHPLTKNVTLQISRHRCSCQHSATNTSHLSLPSNLSPFKTLKTTLYILISVKIRQPIHHKCWLCPSGRRFHRMLAETVNNLVDPKPTSPQGSDSRIRSSSEL
jgi:hypothetical protein